MTKKWNRSAMRIASAKYLSRQGMLEVVFGNGDHFLVAAETVLAAEQHKETAAKAPSWARLRIGPTDDVIEVPSANTILEIPWDRIRACADPDFRAHLADQAKQRARRLGLFVRTFRLEAGLTRTALAAKIGRSGAEVTALEVGKAIPDLNMLEAIADALDRPLRDFAEPKRVGAGIAKPFH